MTAITRRAALGGMASLSAVGGAGAALASSPATMSPEDIDQRIGDLADEISELLPCHPIQRLGSRGWYVEVSERGYWFVARRAPEPHDPLVDAVEAYWKGMETFDRHDLNDNDEINAYADVTYEPPLQILHAWDRPAISREGAIAALRFVVKEGGNLSVSDGIDAMVKAALGYLESGASS